MYVSLCSFFIKYIHFQNVFTAMKYFQSGIDSPWLIKIGLNESKYMTM